CPTRCAGCFARFPIRFRSSSPAARGRLPVSMPDLRFLRTGAAGLFFLLAAEDARDFQPELYRKALVSPDSVVRRVAAIGAGRIGNPAAVPLLVPILLDPDSTVRVAAAFGLGLLGDSAGMRPLMDRLTGMPALDGPSAEEAITALAKIG